MRPQPLSDASSHGAASAHVSRAQQETLLEDEKTASFPVKKRQSCDNLSNPRHQQRAGNVIERNVCSHLSPSSLLPKSCCPRPHLAHLPLPTPLPPWGMYQHQLSQKTRLHPRSRLSDLSFFLFSSFPLLRLLIFIFF